jgi:hypothetical protein
MTMFMEFLVVERDMFIVKSLSPLVIFVKESDGFGKRPRHIHVGTDLGI